MRKKRNKEKNENEANSKLEKLVNEVIVRRRIEKLEYSAVGNPQEFTTLGVDQHQTALYRRSYQVNCLVSRRAQVDSARLIIRLCRNP